MARSARSLSALAGEIDPLGSLDVTIEQLRAATAGSRCFEWKSTGLFGPSVTTRIKYRAVKAAISFANADGGFLLFGVDPNGTWLGLAEEEIAQLDPAKVTELINGVVFPDLPVINYAQFSHAQKSFAVVHIPPSPLVPHATTRDVTETDASGRRNIVLVKYTVYYRHGGKSDAATPSQLQRIVEKRTLHVRDELVRRVREVSVPAIGERRPSSLGSGTMVTVSRLTNDPSAPAVRLTRAPGKGTGVLLHEELSDGLFQEINNVLDANPLLSGATNQFVFGDPVYYRVYAERHHVQSSGGNLDVLLRTACREIYAPFLFWLSITSPKLVAEELVRSVENPKHPLVLGSFKAFVLLGKEATEWLYGFLERKYKRLTQPPEFYFTFKKMVGRTAADRRLLAMRTTNAAVVDVPDAGEMTVSQLFEEPELAATHLSKVCMRVFRGESTRRGLARQLDIAAYGKQVDESAPKIWREIRSLV